MSDGRRELVKAVYGGGVVPLSENGRADLRNVCPWPQAGDHEPACPECGTLLGAADDGLWCPACPWKENSRGC